MGLAQDMQSLFASSAMRVNTTTDVVGVEICGALKNVLAIAAGIVEGLHLGHNAMAALISQVGPQDMGSRVLGVQGSLGDELIPRAWRFAPGAERLGQGSGAVRCCMWALQAASLKQPGLLVRGREMVGLGGCGMT